jgi:5-methylcytosine-specific restriction endonuclease McrA|tara:strand:- start:169 stop:594 length:426 start_codon:yes stop_codon:yes gene_type:complete
MKVADVPFPLPDGFLCPECGRRRGVSVQFDGLVYCCLACAVQAKRRRWRKARRARRLGAYVFEVLDPNLVFLRDHYGCRWCAARTPISLRGSGDDCEPTLDHIIPISMGGAHAYDNVCCSCFRCNHDRGVENGHDLLGLHG